MFKGIITDIGIILSIDGQRVLIKIKGNKRFLQKFNLGDSLACSGICLTIVGFNSEINDEKDAFAVDLSTKTLSITNASTWSIGKEINLEASVLIGDTLDGHFVQGHVDSTAKILSIIPMNYSHEIRFSVSEELTKYIAKNASIALDGVSVTVNEIVDDEFLITIIPHTWNNTTFSTNKVGDPVNVEVDLIARYLERLVYKK